MIQTIVEFNESDYPFDNLEDHINLKLATLVEFKSTQKLVSERSKYQLLKSINSSCLVNLTQIYQEGLIIHLIYESVHLSLHSYLMKATSTCKEEDRQKIKRQLLKNISFQLSNLTQFLVQNKLVTHLHFNNFGVSAYDLIKKKLSIKYFIGSSFQFTQHSREELQKFYFLQRKKILNQIEDMIQMQKRPDNLPNFILRGNKITFTDELSQTKTKRRTSQSPTKERFDRFAEWESMNNRNNFPKYTKTNAKPKKHKYSCNFQQENLNFEFQNDKLNKSVDSQNQNYSITQKKSIKVQMQHTKPSKKNRKNSIKFKITTFQQISIDQSVQQQQPFEGYKRTSTAPDYYPKQNLNESQKFGEQKKNYKQKVQQAKVKAEALLSKYMKSKNKTNN